MQVYRLPANRGIPWFVWAFMAAALVASFLLSLHFLSGIQTLCPFRHLTGLPCPSCGLTRSFVATAHGDLASAFHFHFFGPILFVSFAVALVLRFFCGAEIGQRTETWLLTHWRIWAYPLIGVLLFWFLFRSAL